MSDNQKVIISVVGALVGHLLLFLFLAVLFTLGNLLGSTASQAATPEEPVPEEVTIMLADLLDEVELTPRELEQRYMRTDADQESEEKPENAPFHSDRNTIATSERPPDPSASKEMPSVSGRTDLPFVEIRDREYVDGDFLDQSLASAPSPASMPTPSNPAMPTPAVPQEPTDRPTPIRDPSEVPSEEEKELPADPSEKPREAPDTPPENPAEADAIPDRAAEEETQPEAENLTVDPMLAHRQESFEGAFPATPVRLEEIAKEDREAEAEKTLELHDEPAAPETPEAASAKPQLKQYVPKTQPPVAQASPSEDSPASTASPDVPPTPKPPSDTPAFNSHTRAREMEGNARKIGNTPSFNVEGSALGKYKKAVTQAVERKWHRYRERHSDFVTYGTLKVKFRVDKNGKPRNLKLIKNDANAVMAEFTLRAVLDADIPQMPSEVSSMLGPSGLEISYDVIVY